MRLLLLLGDPMEPLDAGSSNMRRGDSALQGWGGSAVSFLIGITISLMKGRTISRVNALDRPRRRLEVAKPRRSDGDAPHIRPRFDAGWRHDGAHHVAGAEASHHTRRFGRFVREPERIGPTHLSAVPPRRLDGQWNHTLHAENCWRARPHTGCINPMGLGQLALGAIPLGSATRSPLDGQPRLLQPLIERPAGAIDGGSILQRFPRLGLYPRMAIFRRRAVALGLIARMTSEREVRDTV